jgi:hypothetical protein
VSSAPSASMVISRQAIYLGQPGLGTAGNSASRGRQRTAAVAKLPPLLEQVRVEPLATRSAGRWRWSLAAQNDPAGFEEDLAAGAARTGTRDRRPGS